MAIVEYIEDEAQANCVLVYSDLPSRNAVIFCVKKEQYPDRSAEPYGIKIGYERVSYELRYVNPAQRDAAYRKIADKLLRGNVEVGSKPERRGK